MCSLISKSHCHLRQQLPLPPTRTGNGIARVRMSGRMEVVCRGMLKPRKFMQRRRKFEVFKDSADEADQKNWRRIMTEIEESGSAVSVLSAEKINNQNIPKDLVVGTLIRFKQLKKWNLVVEILEWLRTQNWWDFGKMDFFMLITAYGKLGDFNGAEKVLGLMNKNGYAPNVVSQTALMEAYGKGGRYNNAEAIFRRMQKWGPEPSAFTYQIILKTFVQGNKFREAEELFDNLLNDENSPLKPDQKMFNMMIYMHKKAGSYEKARKTFAQMAELGIQQTTVTYNSLMSFETNYKEVSNIYDQMQRADLRPDVVSYALLVSAYGKARREEEALAVFEEMLDAGIRPTRKAYNILLDAFSISGMVEQAQTVFKSMRRDRYFPDLCSYTTMLSAYINADDMEGAEKFFKRLIQDGFEPNVVTYGTLIKGYAKINDLEMVMKKYEEMLMRGIKANQTILTTIMDAYGKSGDFDSAVHWFKEMESNGIPPDQKAKNVLLSLAKTDEEREEANELVVHFSENSSLPKVNGIVKLVDEDEEEDNYEYFDAQLARAYEHSTESVPVYLSEMAPAKIRGALNMGFQMMITIGILIANLINYGTSKLENGWRISLGVGAVPAVLLCFGALFLGDTPNSLIERGQKEEARKMLQKIRGIDNVEEELQELVLASESAKEVEHPWKNITTPKYRPQLTFCTLIPFFQQLTGINVVMFYAPVLFKTLGFGNDASLMSSVITGGVNVVATLVSILTVDKVGRKVLFLEGGVQMLICQIATGVMIAMKFGVSGEGSFSSGEANLILFFICAFVAAFAWSWGPLGWLVPSEICPLEVRSAGQAINVAVNMLFTFAIAQVFLVMLCHLKFGLFFFFAAFVLIMTIFIAMLLPETKNIPIEEMHTVWRSHWFWSKIVPHADDDRKPEAAQS